MSKFKSFASQGNFRDYQLQAPDETAKIREQTARTIRGKERVKRFEDENERIYLQAQKLAQQQEQADRETNFRLESENRKAFKEALDRDYLIQTENDRVRAAQSKQFYEQIASFSKTAFELATTINQTVTETQTKTNAANTILTGNTIQENLAIQSMADNLTEAEFLQQDLILKYIKEGRDPKQLWGMYGRRNSRGFVVNTASIQNTARGLDPYLNEVERNLPPDIKATERKLAIDAAIREYLGDNFNGVNPKLVNTVAGPIINPIITKRLAFHDKEITEEHKKTVRTNKKDTLNTMWDSGGGVKGLNKHFTTNPSQEKREIEAEWIVGRLEAGTMSPEDAEAILDSEYVLSEKDGTTTSRRKQFPDSKEVGLVNQAIRKARQVLVSDNDLRIKVAIDERENALKERYGQQIADGDWSDKEQLELEQLSDSFNLPQYPSDTVKFASTQTNSALTSKAYVQFFTKQFNEGKPISTEYVNSLQGMTLKDRQEVLKLAEQAQTLRGEKTYKPDITFIKETVASVKGINKDDPTVGRMQDKYVQQYNALLNQTQDRNYARQLAIDTLTAELSVPNAVTKDGKFASIVAEDKKFSKGGRNYLETLDQVYSVIRDPKISRADRYLAVLHTIGPVAFDQAYTAMASGKPAPPLFKKVAQALGVTTLDGINGLAAETNSAAYPPITLPPELEQIRQNLKPQSIRLFTSSTRTNEQVERGLMMNNPGEIAVGPVRGESVNPSPQQAYQYMRALGVSDIHAKGILANIKGESGFRTDAMGDSGTSGGLFQMHAGRYQRMERAVPNWRTNWRGQIKHALQDDRAPEYLQLQFNTPEEAADWFLHNFERPAMEHRPGREQLNRSFIRSLGF